MRRSSPRVHTLALHLRARRLSGTQPKPSVMADSSLLDVTVDSSGAVPDRLESSAELLLAAEVAGDALAAVDLEALGSEPLSAAVDAERLGAALGRPAGHLVVRRVVGEDAADGLAGAVAREAAGRACARATRVAVQRFEDGPS